MGRLGAVVAGAAVMLVGVTGCPGEEGEGPRCVSDAEVVAVLEPEPMGAPEGTAEEADLLCIGCEPAPVSAGNIQLLGYLRTYSDPDYADCVLPEGRIEAFDESGTPLAMGFPNTDPDEGGRVDFSIPIRAQGFRGWVHLTSDGFVPLSLRSTRPLVDPAAQPVGWGFLMTTDEIAAVAAEAGVTIEAGRGIIQGAVHDCEGFGIENAVVRIAGSSDGTRYFIDSEQPSRSRCGLNPAMSVRSDHFTLAASRTYTSTSGRFAVANIDPGVVTVEAFGRRAAGRPLELLSRADVTVIADEIAAVDLAPRMGLER